MPAPFETSFHILSTPLISSQAASRHQLDGMRLAQHFIVGIRVKLSGKARQKVVRPPETSKVAPVENEHSSLMSQHTSAALSSTQPRRPMGILERM